MRGRPRGTGNVGCTHAPHRCLVAAMVLNAVEMAKRKTRPRSNPTRAAYDTPEIAREWLAGPKSTRWVCMLGYDPDAFRQALKKRGVLL